MIYVSGSAERMLALLTKTFKISLVLSLFPLGFISVFGTMVAHAWTGETNPSFRVAFWLVSIRAIFGSLSLLALVLYRVSGKALLDNVRQVVRIVLTLGLVAAARTMGFYGVLCGTAIVELIGLLFMIFALTRTFHLFRFSSILPDTLRLTTTVALILSLSAIVLYIPSPGNFGGRALAILKLGEVFSACLIVAWPIILQTGAITPNEVRVVLSSVFSRRTDLSAKIVQESAA